LSDGALASSGWPPSETKQHDTPIPTQFTPGLRAVLWKQQSIAAGILEWQDRRVSSLAP